MSSLSAQLQQLKKQQEELEIRIQRAAETKKKLNNEASIERLEELVKPISNSLDYITNQNRGSNIRDARTACTKQYEIELLQYNQNIITHPTREHGALPRKGFLLETEEIYVTLIGILKKQDERIKALENSN